MAYKTISELAKDLKASEEKVRDVMALNSIALVDVDSTMLEALRSELNATSIAPVVPKKTQSAIDKPAQSTIRSTSAIALPTQSTPRRNASGVVEEALIDQQTEAAKLAADSAASNAVFMQKVRDRAAELDAAQEQADIDAAAKLVRQSRVSARNTTMDFLQSMVGETTNTSIANIRESVEVLEAELIESSK